jgi:hypothetical protein
LASEAAEIIRKVHNGQIKQTSAGWHPSAKQMGYSQEAIDLAQQAFNDSKAGAGYSYCYQKALELVGFDTGGYTGEWGGDGKLGVLHEKELILNKDDTANLLKMIEICRGSYGKMSVEYNKEKIMMEQEMSQMQQHTALMSEIIKSIDLQSISAQLGGLLTSPAVGSNMMREELQQKVEISASFPNVSNHSEIEEAFKTLVNQASQYANRK